MRGENDNRAIADGLGFGASRRALFAPAAVVALSYAGLFLVLARLGAADSALARLCLVVVGVAVPLMVAHAAMKAVTTRVQVFAHAVLVHPGFPRREPMEIPYAVIRSVGVRRGVGGRATGSGTLVLELGGGGYVTACDLADADDAAEAIECGVLAVLAAPARGRGIPARAFAG